MLGNWGLWFGSLDRLRWRRQRTKREHESGGRPHSGDSRQSKNYAVKPETREWFKIMGDKLHGSQGRECWKMQAVVRCGRVEKIKHNGHGWNLALCKTVQLNQGWVQKTFFKLTHITLCLGLISPTVWTHQHIDEDCVHPPPILNLECCCPCLHGMWNRDLIQKQAKSEQHWYYSQLHHLHSGFIWAVSAIKTFFKRPL